MAILSGKNKSYLIGAILLPVVIVWFLVQVQFWFGATIANGPVAILVAVVVGSICGSRIYFLSPSHKLLFWASYLTYLLASVLMVGLFTSCINGDCI
jgi:hypothetical protein